MSIDNQEGGSGRRINRPVSETGPSEIGPLEVEQEKKETTLDELEKTVLNPRTNFVHWDAIVDAIRPVFANYTREKQISPKELKGTQEFFDLVSRVVNQKREQLNVTPDRLPMLTKALEEWFFGGLGIMGPYLEQEGLEEISLNRWDIMFLTIQGQPRRKVQSPFRNPQEVLDFLNRMCAHENKEINYANPSVDLKLEDGSRMHANVAPQAVNGPCFSIRKFRTQKFTMDEYVASGFCTPEFVKDFTNWLNVKKYNMCVVGGTGTGKTTSLNAFGNLMDPLERLIIIEDTKELQIDLGMGGEVYLQSTRDKGIRDGVRDALRMFPDRIIVGEVRGPEAREMLQAMNTGHDGSLGTFHANTGPEAIGRLESMATESKEQSSNIVDLIAWALDIVVVIARERTEKGYHRHVSEVWQFFHPNQVEESGKERLRELHKDKKIWVRGSICGLQLYKTPLATGVLEKVEDPLPLTGKG